MGKHTKQTKLFCSLFLLGTFLLSCLNNRPHEKLSFAVHAAIDSIVKANRNIDSLTVLLQRYDEAGNVPGMIPVCKELGRRYRDKSRFGEAIDIHREGLELALQAGDTLEAVQALNNIGTNFRRMGILDEASTYHYQALLLCEQCGDKSGFTAKKNRVVSLNGIGNIHLTLDNREAADSVFRVALAGERELNSELGQAINYANLGAIFEARGMKDSALVYYEQSMKFNRAAKSTMGISLCHNHFGRLFEQDGRWEEALREYRSAYDLMIDSDDRWHWLESCLALARVNVSKGDIAVARVYLERAKKTAEEMRSWEHLSEVYRLDYLCYEKQGNCRRALDCYIKSHAYTDSVRNEDNMNHVQNLRVNYEKERNSRELTLVHENYQVEHRTKNLFLTGSFIILFITVIAIGLLWYALRMKSRNQRMLRRMEKVRSNFFTNVTHEFRTPLTVILGLVEQLQHANVSDEEIKTALNTIARQGHSLLGLVNQLLEVSKVKSEIGKLEWRTGDVVAYVRMIMENYQTYARQRQVDLHFTPSEMVVVMDFVPEYFCKTICNLLSNSLKFTPKGGQITVGMKKEGDHLLIWVADTGCGISPEDLPSIFKTFYQGENSRANIGTGIGLALVRQMTESMDGKIRAESTVGEGTEISIVLPLKHGDTMWKRWLPEKKTDGDAEACICEETDGKVPEENVTSGTVAMPVVVDSPEEGDMPGDGSRDKAGDKTKEKTEAGERARPAILIVEDNADVSYYIGGLLKKKYRLLYARNGEEGLEKAKEFMPDLIITDLMMPEMNGYELCQSVRCSEILNHIPIIIITAKCGADDRVQGLETGADAYLEKPFNADELHVRIVQLLEQRRLLREKYSNAMHEGKVQSVGLPLVDKNFLTRLNDAVYSMMGDHNLNSEMVAERMCMSLSQLNRKVKAITGFSSSGYILQMRLDKAKRMLASTDTPIGEIAVKCGFLELSYFSRIFKQTFQMTPSQYRKKL